MSNNIAVSAGTRTRIFRLFSSSIASTVRFNAEAKGGGDPSGTIEVDRWYWFVWKHETLPLKAQNAIEKRFADADFLIHVIADQDCEITFESRKPSYTTIGSLLAVILLVAIAAAIFVLTAGPAVGPVGN